jgi:uncharacterized membrane protein
MFNNLRVYLQLSRTRIKRRHVIWGSLVVFFLAISAFELLRISPYDASSVVETSTSSYQSQVGAIKYVRAKVLQVENLQQNQNSDNNQQATVRLLDGPEAGQVITVSRNDDFGDASYRSLPIGSEILLSVDSSTGKQYIYYQDRYRITGAITLFLIFLGLVVAIGRWRGFTGVLGLVISLVVLSAFVLPRILAGDAAFATCLEGAFMIAALSIFVAHGLSKRTAIAFMGIVLTLLITAGVAVFSVYLTGVTGFLGEDSIPLQDAPHPISFSGLLLGGLVIASLGVLNDITTAQSAAIDEIYKANPRQSTLKLYRGGLSVGREHIAALVNTLALAYVGVSLPTIVITALQNHAPLLVVINSEPIMDEIVRTFVASIGLLLAVPITSGLAAYLLPLWYHRSVPSKPALIRRLLDFSENNNKP